MGNVFVCGPGCVRLFSGIEGTSSCGVGSCGGSAAVSVKGDRDPSVGPAFCSWAERTESGVSSRLTTMLRDCVSDSRPLVSLGESLSNAAKRTARIAARGRCLRPNESQRISRTQRHGFIRRGRALASPAQLRCGGGDRQPDHQSQHGNPQRARSKERGARIHQALMLDPRSSILITRPPRTRPCSLVLPA